MKKLILGAEIMLEESGKNLLLIFFTTLLSFLLLSVIQAQKDYYKVLELGKASGIDQMITYKVPFSASMASTEELKEYFIDPIRSTEGVEDCYSIPSYETSIVGNGVLIDIEEYSFPIHSAITYKLVDGKWPKKGSVNEIVLSEDLSSAFHIGDRISGTTLIGESAGDYKKVDFELTVIGFLDMSDLVVSSTEDSEYANMENCFSTIKEKVYKQSSGYGIVMNLESNEGIPITKLSRNGSFYIDVVDGYQLQEVKDNLSEVLSDTSFLHTGTELVNGYKVEHREQLMTLIGEGILALGLTLTTLFSTTFLQLRKKRKEMTVYYMSGATWKQSIRLFCLVFVPVEFIGVIIGSAIYYSVNSYRLCAQYENIVLVFLFLLLVSFLGVLPFYFVTKNCSPMELLRKD